MNVAAADHSDSQRSWAAPERARRRCSGASRGRHRGGGVDKQRQPPCWRPKVAANQEVQVVRVVWARSASPKPGCGQCGFRSQHWQKLRAGLPPACISLTPTGHGASLVGGGPLPAWPSTRAEEHALCCLVALSPGHSRSRRRKTLVYRLILLWELSSCVGCWKRILCLLLRAH